jgi:uncharacterized protein YvpB
MLPERWIIRFLGALLAISTAGMLYSSFLIFQQNKADPQAWSGSFQGAFSEAARPLAAAWSGTQTPAPTWTPTWTIAPTHTPTQPSTPSPAPTRTESPTPTGTPTQTPEPAFTETPAPPESASIDSVVGHAQSYSLDCESRSAADLAAYFGITFNHMEFQKRLPVSDDPDEGYVGFYNGAAGLPPGNYGVHARPVASLLRAYNLNAHAGKHLSFDQLKYEIAAGRPVMVWVVNSVVNGKPVAYTAKNGHTSRVVYLEHTVILTGYDAQQVTIVDGSMTYHRSIDQFLASWAVLENMAVVVGDPQMIDRK